jgi:hypothetical protein
MAWAALTAHRVTGRTAYVELAANAVDWLLGLNPDDECLLAGAGGAACRAAGPGAPDGAVVPPGRRAGEAIRIDGTAAYLMALALC